MDARLNPYGPLGLSQGDAHVIRNAGGVTTADELWSLAVSQWLLATEKFVLVHHTDCGMLMFTGDEFRGQVMANTGIKPARAAEAFDDVDVRRSLARIQGEPSIPYQDWVRGFVYDATTARLCDVV